MTTVDELLLQNALLKQAVTRLEKALVLEKQGDLRPPPRCGDYEPPRIVPAGWTEQVRQANGGRWHNPALKLVVIITAAQEQDGRRWIHLSCSHAARMPRWRELVEVKELFVGKDRYAYQVIPPADRYVNIDPRVLHLWVCLDGEPPIPDFLRGGFTL